MDVRTQLIDAEAIVRRIERDADTASELYQELWLACLKQDNIDWSIPQVGRIVRVAQRLRVNRFRRATNCRWILEHYDWKHRSESPGSEPGSEIVRAEDCQHLRSALNRLPIKHRRAVEQKYIVEQEDEILATEMQVDVATIRKWRSRGIDQLRDALRVHHVLNW